MEIAILALAAAVSCPWALNVKVPTDDALPYDPAATVVLAIEIVPAAVIGPPVRPVPVPTKVTAPEGRVDHPPVVSKVS